MLNRLVVWQHRFCHSWQVGIPLARCNSDIWQGLYSLTAKNLHQISVQMCSFHCFCRSPSVKKTPPLTVLPVGFSIVFSDNSIISSFNTLNSTAVSRENVAAKNVLKSAGKKTIHQFGNCIKEYRNDTAKIIKIISCCLGLELFIHQTASCMTTLPHRQCRCRVSSPCSRCAQSTSLPHWAEYPLRGRCR